MKAPKFPLYPLTLFFVLGMTLLFQLTQKWLWVAVSVFFILGLFKKYRPFIYLIFLPLGGLYQQQYYQIPADHYRNLLDAENTLCVAITEVLKSNDFQHRFYGKIVRVDQKKSLGKVLIVLDKKKSNNQPIRGDLLITKSQPKELLSRKNPGDFDYKIYLNKIKIYDQIRVRNNDFIIVKKNKNSVLDQLYLWNDKLEKKLDKSGLATVSKNTIKTLLLGKRDGLDQELKNAYAKAGVIHVLAISGLHIGIIMFFLGVVLKPIKSIPGGHWIYVPSILTLLWVFAFFTGGSPSVIRAVTMFTGLVIAKYSLRVSNTFHLLVVSFFLLVVVYPPFLYQVGFQMSYLAVLGIIKLHPLFQKLWQPKNFILKKIWEITTVCLAAQIAVAPLSIYYFNQFPGLFLLSNWIILPFFGFFLMGSIGLLLLIGADHEIPVFSLAYDKVVAGLNESIFWIASQESFLFQNLSISTTVLLFIYILIILLYLLITHKKIKYLIAILSMLLLLQLYVIKVAWSASQINKIWLLYQYENTVIGHHVGKNLTLYSSKKISRDEVFISNFKSDFYIDSVNIKAFKNTYVSHDFQLLIIDKKVEYKIPGFFPTHLLITDDPKVNLDRVLDYLRPQKVICDGSNKPWNVARWQKSCQKRNIPFINLNQQGAFPINL